MELVSFAFEKSFKVALYSFVFDYHRFVKEGQHVNLLQVLFPHLENDQHSHNTKNYGHYNRNIQKTQSIIVILLELFKHLIEEVKFYLSIDSIELVA